MNTDSASALLNTHQLAEVTGLSGRRIRHWLLSSQAGWKRGGRVVTTLGDLARVFPELHAAVVSEAGRKPRTGPLDAPILYVAEVARALGMGTRQAHRWLAKLDALVCRGGHWLTTPARLAECVPGLQEARLRQLEGE